MPLTDASAHTNGLQSQKSGALCAHGVLLEQGSFSWSSLCHHHVNEAKLPVSLVAGKI